MVGGGGPVERPSAGEFFCATRDDFDCVAGEVLALRESDFDDHHRRRHLESYAKSNREWNRYENTFEKQMRTHGDVAALFAEELVVGQQNADGGFGPWLDRALLEDALVQLRRKHKASPSVPTILRALNTMVALDGSRWPVDDVRRLQKILVKRGVRSSSGVAVVTVLTAPGSFSCTFDCAFCPNEPGQPRSYLSTEPAVMRANQNKWDAARQFWDRCTTLSTNGHVVDKLEVLVLGGTWSGYPEDYQESFVRDLYYAANVYPDVMELNETQGSWRENVHHLRPRFSLRVEQLLNEFAPEWEPAGNNNQYPRLIGLTLETRPDQITPREIHRLRFLGCTRVQMGVQHTNDDILRKIRRQQTTAVVKGSLRLLKDAGFKVDIHLMPDLPFSTPELDREMFREVLSNPELQVDQWKIYPCEVTPFSSIENWHRDGKYVPYGDVEQGKDLIKLIAGVKRLVYPWIRLNRVIRDIPEPTIIAGNNQTNLRQVLSDVMDSCGWRCRCMRCREVRDSHFKDGGAVMKLRRYDAQGGLEYFISYETEDERTLFAFLRLRICDGAIRAGAVSDDEAYRESMNPNSRIGESFMDAQVRERAIRSTNRDKKKEQVSFQSGTLHDVSTTFPELPRSIARVRELHVYGSLVGTGKEIKSQDSRSQHRGFGTLLLTAAEIVSLYHGCDGLSVIAGTGVRDYYRRRGFEYESLNPMSRCPAPSGDTINQIRASATSNEAESLANDHLGTLGERALGFFLLKPQPSASTIREKIDMLNQRFNETGVKFPSFLRVEHYDVKDLKFVEPCPPDFSLGNFASAMTQWKASLRKAEKKLKKRPNRSRDIFDSVEDKPQLPAGLATTDQGVLLPAASFRLSLNKISK